MVPQKLMGRTDVYRMMGISRPRLTKGASVNSMGKIAMARNWHPTEADIFSDSDSLEKNDFNMFGVDTNSKQFNDGLNNGLGLGAATLAVSGLAYGLGKAVEGAQGFMAERKQDEALRTAIQMSPTLQRQGYDFLKGYMPMVAKASPTVATEPRLLANYLETMVDAGGNLNLATFAEIANLENTLSKNDDNRNSVSNTLLNTAVKGIAEKGTSAIANNVSKNWGKTTIGVQQTLF